MDKTKEEILKEEYEKIVALHPEQNWMKWGKDDVSVEISINAMVAYADQEKRKEAIAFLNAITQDGCNNYFRIGDSWFLGEDENDEDPAGPFTSEQLYDLYLQSLNPTHNKP